MLVDPAEELIYKHSKVEHPYSPGYGEKLTRENVKTGECETGEPNTGALSAACGELTTVYHRIDF
jgi:hypothetical protein